MSLIVKGLTVPFLFAPFFYPYNIQSKYYNCNLNLFKGLFKRRLNNGLNNNVRFVSWWNYFRILQHFVLK